MEIIEFMINQLTLNKLYRETIKILTDKNDIIKI